MSSLFRRLGMLIPALVFLGILAQATDNAYGQDSEAADLIGRFRSSYDWCGNVSLSLVVEGKWDNVSGVIRREETTVHNDRFERFAESHLLSFRDLETQQVADMVKSHFVFLGEDEVAMEFTAPLEHDVNPAGFYAVDTMARKKLEGVLRDPDRQGVFFGTVPMFSRKSLPDLLSEATSLEVGDDEVNGVACKVLTGETPDGIVTVWVAPEQGYMMQKCRLVKEAGKHLDLTGEPFDASTQYEGATRPAQTLTTEIELLEAADTEKGAIPVAYSYVAVADLGDVQTECTRVSFTITDFDLDPDFEAIGAFDSPFEEGTKVSCVGDSGRLIHGFVWADGKVVPEVDSGALAAVSESVAAIKTGNAVAAVQGSREEAPSTGGGAGPAQMPYVLLLGAGVLCLALGMALRVKSKARGRGGV
ncbi:MAG: hypothetical protein JXR94_16025 [Candidatus Hydrogenedentes bacterium]|nr:hypothetical protein [Candidatus Hydrogenedentota bacterium]